MAAIGLQPDQVQEFNDSLHYNVPVTAEQQEAMKASVESVVDKIINGSAQGFTVKNFCTALFQLLDTRSREMGRMQRVLLLENSTGARPSFWYVNWKMRNIYSNKKDNQTLEFWAKPVKRTEIAKDVEAFGQFMKQHNSSEADKTDTEVGLKYILNYSSSELCEISAYLEWRIESIGDEACEALDILFKE